jgi:4-amino-4-deoxy-L-arabinose transferase-like glycosyltransferase
MKAERRSVFSPVLGGVLLFALLSRVAYLLWYGASDPLYGHPLHDARLYHDWAVAFVEGRDFALGSFYQAPGFPWFLGAVYALFGANPLGGYVVQSLLGLAPIVLVHRVALRAYGERAALCAAGLAALYGVYPFYETKLVSASLAVFLLALLMERLQAATTSKGIVAWILAGIVAGAACLTRPNVLLVLPLIVGLLFAQREPLLTHRVPRIAAFLVASGLLILPVTARNHRASGEWVLISSNGGLTFYHGNNPAAEGWLSAPGMSGSVFTQREESRRLAEAAMGRTLADGVVSRFWFGRGMAFIRSNPAGYLLLEARKAFLALDDYEHGLEYNPQLDRNPVRWALPVSFAVILALAALRGFGPRRIERNETAILLVLVVQAATLLIFYAAGRYRLPMTVPLLASAGYGASMLVRRLRTERRRAVRMLAVSVLVAAVSVLKIPPGGSMRYRTLSASAVADIGLAYDLDGNHERSVVFYRDAIDRDPSYAYAHLDVARPLRRLDRLEEAEAALKRAVELAPELAPAWFELGGLYLELRRPAAAAPAFAEAFRLDPTNAAAGSNLIGTYLTLGRRAEADALWRVMIARGLEIQDDLEAWMRGNVTRGADIRGVEPE